LYKIFGACDRSSLDYLRICVKLDGIKQLPERRRCAFIEQLLGDCRFSSLLLMHVQNSIFSIGPCLGVCGCVCVSVCLVAFYSSFIFLKSVSLCVCACLVTVLIVFVAALEA